MNMTLRAVLRDRRGATAIEYGMIAACCAILIISSLSSIGESLNDIFASLQSGFTTTP